MRAYTAREIKILKSNPYTFKVTRNRLYFTTKFKEAFWTAYQAGTAPRKILRELGYDTDLFAQKQIDSVVQRIKEQARIGKGFDQVENRAQRKNAESAATENVAAGFRKILSAMSSEIKYRRQENDFLKNNCLNQKYSNEEILLSSSWKFEVIQKTLQEAEEQLSVSLLCNIAGVSRSGYYRWLDATSTRDEKERMDRKDFELILRAYCQRGYHKGARSIYMCMVHWEPPVVMNLKKIRRLMDKYGLVCPVRRANPYRHMTRAIQTNPVADNILNRKFTENGPRKVLLTDITYIPYHGTFAYLATVLDAKTRQVLSYTLSDSLEADFVLETVEKLFRDHGSELTKETMIHSDQGSHYTCANFISLIHDKELRQSMSRRGNCWDNAPQESFFGHMKDELNVNQCTQYQEVKALVDDWLDYYNNSRYQWHLARLSPNEYYSYITTGIYPLEGIIRATNNEHTFPKTDE